MASEHYAAEALSGQGRGRQISREAARPQGLDQSEVHQQERESLWPEAAKRQRGETTLDPWEDLINVFLRERADNAAARAKAIADGFDAATDDDGDAAPGSDLPARRVLTSELYAAVGVADAAQTKGLSQRIRTVMESLWLDLPRGRAGPRQNQHRLRAQKGRRGVKCWRCWPCAGRPVPVSY